LSKKCVIYIIRDSITYCTEINYCSGIAYPPWNPKGKYDGII